MANDNERKQDEVADRLQERVQQHFTDTPPGEVVDNVETILREMGEAGMIDTECGHVPARHDVDLTLCWKCGVEILADIETHLWRPLTVNEKLLKRETVRQLRDLFLALSHSEYSTALWEKIKYKLAPSIHLAQSAFGRWIIVSGQSEDLAWSGSRWVPHDHGIPTGGIQVSNFETREEAAAYAKEQFPEALPDR